MRIIQLTAENIKRLKAINITPNEHINRISGPNGSGKTSILDAIEWALQGTSKVPSAPVRKGSGKAVIILKTEEFTVTRRFMEGGSRNGTLAIEANDTRNRFQGPQEMLDSLLGNISFDPLEFIRMHPKKQFEVLRSLVKLDVDVTKLDADQKVDYDKRRELKKEVTALETRRDAIKVAEGLPAKKKDEAALVTELREVSDYNEGIARDQRDRDEFSKNLTILGRDIDEQMERVAQLRAQADELQAEADGWAKQHEKNTKLMQKWEPLAATKDAGEIADAITAARTINAAIDKRTDREKLQKDIDAKEAEVETLSAALKERDETKVKAMEAAAFPVKGLGFGEEEVMFEGLPFNQISNADQIRASVAIGIAYNPKMRVMRIKDGSLLDDKSMAILSQMSVSENMQLFLEVVDTSGKIGVYLEDGEVKAVNDEPLNIAAEKGEAKPRARKKKTLQ